VVSVTDPYGRILNFLGRSRYIFLQVAPQLYLRGSVDPVPDPLLLRQSGSAGNRTWDLWIFSQELRSTLYPQKLALTWPTSDGYSVSIVRARTLATEFVCF
jgi:hypothetical protein